MCMARYVRQPRTLHVFALKCHYFLQLRFYNFNVSDDARYLRRSFFIRRRQEVLVIEISA